MMPVAEMNAVAARTTALVRAVLDRNGVDRAISPSDTLTEAGVSSLDMVNLMLALEAEFDVFIPPASVTAANFRSLDSICSMLRPLVDARSR